MRSTPASRIASSRFSVPTVLFRKYFVGLLIDSPTSALAAKCMTASIAMAREDLARAAPGRTGCRARGSPFHGPVVALAHVVEDDGHVSRCREQLRGVAADVAGAAGHENAHGLVIIESDLADANGRGARRRAVEDVHVHARFRPSTRARWRRTRSPAPLSPRMATVPPLPPPVIFAP